MIEATEYLQKEDEDIKSFINKFTELKLQQGKDFRKKLKQLNLMKISEKHISKIIDILPTNQEEINKIFTDISLDEDEIKKIIDIVKQFK